MKTIHFLGYTINAASQRDIQELALAKVQERANRLYCTEPGYSVASAWIEAVLEFLLDEARNSPSALLNANAPATPLTDPAHPDSHYIALKETLNGTNHD